MKQETLPPILLLAGPTASGKSALALEAAASLDAEIVNADAMQVYADLSVITARPTAQEMARVPHHLYGHVDAAERYSVGRWREAALRTIAAIHERGRRALLVGGTGLYFDALINGLAEIPDIKPETRAAVRAELENRGGDRALHERALAVDPEAAQHVSPSDRQRLLRILEVARQTGRPLSAWRADTQPGLPAESWRGVVLQPDRTTLYARIDARAERIMRDGAVEATTLLARGLDPSQPALKALGVAHVRALVENHHSADEALALLQRDTRRYAKRQMTWFRNRFKDWAVLETTTGDSLMDAFKTRGVPVSGA